MEEYQERGNIENALHLPCPSCGNQLQYKADKKQISCGHCGYGEEVNSANDQVVETALEGDLKQAKHFVPEEVNKKVFDCQNCAAKFMVESDQMQITCGFCGSNNVNVDALEHQYIKPVGIIPFYVSKEMANEKFSRWIRQGAFHPNKLKKLSRVEGLHGMYIPFWTYDAKTESTWQGQAGHYTQNNVPMPNSRGGMRNQRIPNIRWQSRSGRLNHFFDDVLVVASGKIEQREVEKMPFKLKEVVNFDPRLIMGWESEVYQIELDEGYGIAEQLMDHRLRNMCSAQLGGDTQRNLHVSSKKYAKTYKHIVLPFWICSYTYQNKIYRFLINGQTGRVHGKKPLSWFKIALLILLIVLIFVGIWYLRHSGILRGKFNF